VSRERVDRGSAGVGCAKDRERRRRTTDEKFDQESLQERCRISAVPRSVSKQRVTYIVDFIGVKSQLKEVNIPSERSDQQTLDDEFDCAARNLRTSASESRTWSKSLDAPVPLKDLSCERASRRVFPKCER